jgi:hypothetical protein
MPLVSPLVMVLLATSVAAGPVRGRCADALPMPVAGAASPTVPMPEVRPRSGAVRMPNACAVQSPLAAGRIPGTPFASGRTLVPGRAVVTVSPLPPSNAGP